MIGIVATGLILAVVGWDDYSEHLGRASLGWLVLAVVFLLLGNLTSALLAADLLRQRGHQANELAVTRVVLVSNVAKYMPGFVLQLATFHRMSRGIGLSTRQAGLLWLETTWINVVVAPALGAAALLVAGGDIPWPLVALVLVGAVVFAIPAIRDRVLTVVGLAPSDGERLHGLQPKATGLAALGVVALGFHGTALAQSIGATEISWFEVVAALAGGWIFGLVLVIFPGGLGPREVAATALLAQFTDADVAVVIIVLSRLASVVADVLAGAIAALLPTTQAPFETADE